MGDGHAMWVVSRVLRNHCYEFNFNSHDKPLIHSWFPFSFQKSEASPHDFNVQRIGSHQIVCPTSDANQ